MKKLIIAVALCLGLGELRAWAVSQPNSLGVVTASTTTFTGGVALWNRTAAQILALTPTTTGQMVWCSDCVTNGGKGTVCTSTGSTTANQMVLSTGTVCK